MAVYIDDMHLHPAGQLGRMKMSHMIADSSVELLTMADRIGLNRRWLQYPGSAKEHFDVSLAYRQLAVERGAIEVTMRQMAAMVRHRKQSGA